MIHGNTLYKAFFLPLIYIVCSTLSVTYADTTAKNKQDVEWLFVITSKQGQIKKNTKGNYELLIKHAHIERILAFSDRPNRIVQFIEPTQLKKIWHEGGKESFKADPPNAVAVFGQEKITMILTSVSVKKNQILFSIKGDQDKLHDVKMHSLSLFIDSGYKCLRWKKTKGRTRCVIIGYGPGYQRRFGYDKRSVNTTKKLKQETKN